MGRRRSLQARHSRKGRRNPTVDGGNRHARHCAGRPPVPQRPRNQSRDSRVAHEFWPGRTHGRLHRALGNARAPHSPGGPMDVSHAPLRRRKGCRRAPRPRPYSAKQLRLRPGRAHHRPGARDSGKRRQNLHRAQNRRGLQPGRRPYSRAQPARGVERPSR